MTTGLKFFWIKSPSPHAPMGFGVTAYSLEDAVAIIRALGHGLDLPDDAGRLQVRDDVTVADLDPLHVVPNMGPMVVRGMWYPRSGIGLPDWAEERVRVLLRGDEECGA